MAPPKIQAKSRRPEEIRAGDLHRFELNVDEPLVQAFASLSGDFNPLHTDTAYARSVGFRSGVAHGALQVAWVSQAVGMWLIGVRCLVRKISSDFRAPLIYPCRVLVESQVLSWIPKHESGRVSVAVKNADSQELFSEHTVEVGVHPEAPRERAPAQSKAAVHAQPKRPGSRRTVLVTGGTGGMLRQLALRLLKDYDVVILGRHEKTLKEVAAEAGNPAGLRSVALDLVKDVDRLEEHLEASLPEDSFWAVIHGASLPIMQQSILEVEPERLAEEWAMTVTAPIRLARWLSKRAGDQGGRVLMIGSESTKLLPQLHALPRAHLYGLGKRLLRETSRVLAQELAPKKITVNTLHPGPIPAGMNAGMSPSSIRMLEAENPMKRLCNNEDLCAAVLFFLGEPASYVSGQDLYLNGGRF